MAQVVNPFNTGKFSGSNIGMGQQWKKGLGSQFCVPDVSVASVINNTAVSIKPLNFTGYQPTTGAAPASNVVDAQLAFSDDNISQFATIMPGDGILSNVSLQIWVTAGGAARTHTGVLMSVPAGLAPTVANSVPTNIAYAVASTVVLPGVLLSTGNVTYQFQKGERLFWWLSAVSGGGFESHITSYSYQLTPTYAPLPLMG